MIFFPIIWASLIIALPRIISAAPVSEPLVIDNNPSVGRSVEISPLLGLAWPGHYDEEIAWNEGQTKSKDEESGNYEDNHQNQNPESIVQSMLQNNDDAAHIERTQGYNGVDNYLPPGMMIDIERSQDFNNNNNNNQPPGMEIEERPPQSGETVNCEDETGETVSCEDEESNYYGETESEDKGSNYDINSGINININIKKPTSE